MQMKGFLCSLAALASSSVASDEALSLIQIQAHRGLRDACDDAKEASNQAKQAFNDLKKQMKDLKASLKTARADVKSKGGELRDCTKTARQTAKSQKSKGGERDVEVDIGSWGGANQNTKCVDMPQPIVSCEEDAGHFGKRVNDHGALDTFRIYIQGNQVCAQRTDQQSGGWGMDLRIACSSGSKKPKSTPNVYERAAGVGGWGGMCTCPDGQQYNVGDMNDACGSLACVGGTPGPCERVGRAERTGMKATCGSGKAPKKAKEVKKPNVYERVGGVGAWGGTCTCPDGQVYQVGDYNNYCGSLACIGGTPSQCEQVGRSERTGMQATCG
jgi:hypothetical protein